MAKNSTHQAFLEELDQVKSQTEASFRKQIQIMEQNHAMKVQQLSRDSEEQRAEIERLEVALEKEKRKTVSQEGIIANLKEELSSHISPAFVHQEVSYMYIYKCMHIITTNIHSASNLLLIRLKKTLCVFFTLFTIINHISPTTASFCK